MKTIKIYYCLLKSMSAQLCNLNMPELQAKKFSISVKPNWKPTCFTTHKPCQKQYVKCVLGVYDVMFRKKLPIFLPTAGLLRPLNNDLSLRVLLWFAATIVLFLSTRAWMCRLVLFTTASSVHTTHALVIVGSLMPNLLSHNHLSLVLI